MEIANHNVGEAIRIRRKARGWSQEKLARELEVGALAVGKWERGQALPTYENRVRLTEILGLTDADMGITDAGITQPPEWFTHQIEQQAAHNAEVISLLKRIVRKTGA